MAHLFGATAMAQEPPKKSSEPTHRLPRPRRIAASKPYHPRIHLMDIVWIFLVALVSIGTSWVSQASGHWSTLNALIAAATAVLLYLLGWRARDRSTGVIAGLFLATSIPFATLVQFDLLMSMFTLVTVTALFAYLADSRIGTIVLTALAAFGFVVALQHPAVHVSISLVAWLMTPATIFFIWLLLPFFAELSEPGRGARWYPVALWTILYFIAESLFHFQGNISAILPMMPMLFLMAACGLARLLPVLAGDVPILALRYALATCAVLLLIGGRAQSEWNTLRPLASASTASNTAAAENHPAITPPSSKALPAPVPIPVPASPKKAKPIAVTPSAKPVAIHTMADRRPIKPTPKAVPMPKAKPIAKAAPLAKKPPVKPIASIVKRPAAAPPHAIKLSATPKVAAAPKKAIPKPLKQITKAPVAPAPRVLQITVKHPAVQMYVRRHGRLVRRSRWAILWDLKHTKH